MVLKLCGDGVMVGAGVLGNGDDAVGGLLLMVIWRGGFGKFMCAGFGAIVFDNGQVGISN